MEKYDYYTGELNPLVWNGEEKLLEEVSDNLMEIVYDFVDTINGKINAELDIDDVILTGSLANLNWNKFSDFDLHILTDLEELSNNYDLNKLAVDELKNNWNKTHDIKINGYDVETYFQDVNEPHIASGVYSVLNDEWITKPEYSAELDKQVESQEDEIIALFDRYDSQVRNLLDVEVDSLDEEDITELQTALEHMMDSIKKLRRDEEIGLNSEMGEYSIGNLAFKMLRNAGTIGELLELKNTLYDMSYSFENEILGESNIVLSIGDNTNLGEIEDLFDSPNGMQYQINGSWYHKSLVTPSDDIINNEVKNRGHIDPNKIISAFSNPLDNNKVEKYIEDMSEKWLSHTFPPIKGFPDIISKSDIGNEFINGNKITEKNIGEYVWFVTDGHHRSYAGLEVGIPYLETIIDNEYSNSNDFFYGD